MNQIQEDYIDAIDGIEANRIAIEKFNEIIEDKNEEYDYDFLQRMIGNMQNQNRKYNSTIRHIKENFPEVEI